MDGAREAGEEVGKVSGATERLPVAGETWEERDLPGVRVLVMHLWDDGVVHRVVRPAGADRSGGWLPLHHFLRRYVPFTESEVRP